MTIMPAWIREQTDAGVWAVLGSEPPLDAPEKFIPSEEIESVVVPPGAPVVQNRSFGVIVLRQGM